MNNIAPVLLVVFNRPETTIKVFEKLREAKPPKLYIAADGPRQGNNDDAVKCRQVLDIVNNVDWKCDLKTDFSPVNLGCGARPSSAISWVLEHESNVIILEDDCVPAVSFFSYCTDLLEKYKNEEQIMHISGTRYLKEIQLNDDSYFFSRYQRPWGWATWKRAWERFDHDMQSYSDCITNNYLDFIFDPLESKYWKWIFDNSVKDKFHIWDYQWQYAVFVNNGLCIVPKNNLISNLGDEGGTHVVGKNDYYHQDLAEDFKIEVHPKCIVRNIKYDKEWFKKFNGSNPLHIRVVNKLKKILFGFK